MAKNLIAVSGHGAIVCEVLVPEEGVVVKVLVVVDCTVTLVLVLLEMMLLLKLVVVEDTVVDVNVFDVADVVLLDIVVDD